MAGKIPSEFIDEVLARVDIVDVIDHRTPLTRAGKEYKARCPFHDERTPSFTVSQSKQFYHCFGCGAHGSAIRFLMDYAHLEFREAVEELAESVGLQLPTDSTPVAHSDSGLVQLYETVAAAEEFYRQQLRSHEGAETAIAYLKQRGLTGKITADFGIGYAPDGWSNLLDALGEDDTAQRHLHKTGLVVERDQGGYYDRFRHRVMFPIHDHRGRTVGFGGRILGDGEPKYLNSPETPLFHKGKELYGLHRARGAIREAQQSIVVEGYMDVVALAQHDIHNAVATLGTATTRHHSERLFRLAPETIFCFDGDRAGRDAAWRALEIALPILFDGRQIGFLFLPDGEDPDSLVRTEGTELFRERLRDATPLPDFLFGTLSRRTDLERLDGRARLVELARPFLSKLPQGVLRELMFERLADLSGTAPGSLLRRIPVEPDREQSAKTRRTMVSGLRGGRPSPVRLAIILLVQNPHLGKLGIDCAQLRGLELPGIELLIDVALQLELHPDISTAALVERFRGTEHHEHLEKLAVWEHLPEDNADAVYRDTIDSLRRRLQDQEYQLLLAKSESGPLEPEDKKRLLALLEFRRNPMESGS